jgi:Domain of unknown function (DUF4326)
MTEVFNIRTSPDVVKDSNYVYIGRGSKWGNPFTHLDLKTTGALYQVKTREEAIQMYKKWFYQQYDLIKAIQDGELKDKKLGCFCKPKDCHGDFLAELSQQWKTIV